MNHIVLAAFSAAVGTYLVTALGAATVIFFKKENTRALNIMLGFASGVMIAASFWSLLEPAIERANEYLKVPDFIVATSGFLLGAAFMWFSDKCVSGARKRLAREKEAKEKSLNRIFLLVFSITLHNIPEGLAIGVAFGALGKGEVGREAFFEAFSIAVGIGLQNFPEGAAVSLPLRREGYSKRKSFLIGQATALVEPASALLGALLVTKIEALLPYALSFAAGAMILVAVHELIPECQKSNGKSPYAATLGIVSGFAVMMLLDVALS